MAKKPTRKTMLDVIDRTVWYRIWLRGLELLTRDEAKQITEALEILKSAIEKLPDGIIS